MHNQIIIIICLWLKTTSKIYKCINILSHCEKALYSWFMFGNVYHMVMSEYPHISHRGAMVHHIVMTSLCAYHCDVEKFVAFSQRKEFCNIMRYEHECHISKSFMFITLRQWVLHITLWEGVIFVTLRRLKMFGTLRNERARFITLL